MILERVQRPINGEHMMMDAGWTSHVEQRRRVRRAEEAPAFSVATELGLH